jgi:hypothetical protein
MRRRWTGEERAFLAESIPGRWRSEVCALFAERFGRPITERQVKDFAATWRVLSGMRGTPPDSNARQTCFKAGRTPHNQRPIGAEEWRLGYLWRKVAETQPSRHGWRAVHRLVWEEANGPVPEGCEVAFRDGDRTHITLDNLMLITSSEHLVMARRGLFGAGEAGRTCADLISAAYRRQQERSKR